MIMVGHISLPNVTGDETPASLSHEIVRKRLREQMGYDGVVVTDAMNMGAVAENYEPAEAAVKALQAGGSDSDAGGFPRRLSGRDGRCRGRNTEQKAD